MTHAIVAIAFLLVSQASHEPSEIIQRNLKDITFTAKTKVGNQYELAKINKDFGDSYRVPSMNVWAKEPFKVRVESKIKETDALYIINGTTRLTSIPRIRLRQKENVAKGPGKRQTFLDFGLITRSMLDELFDARFIRVDRATSDLVFDLTYPKSMKDTSRHRIWVDPDKRYITKREWYNQKGRQLATFLYESPKQIDGVWMPTLATVKNVDNKVAGVLEYVNIHVNTGLSESLFKID
jgi:outer membrane lipoprotein-sorting protein